MIIRYLLYLRLQCLLMSRLQSTFQQGWSYVGDRLLSAVIPYEETGWYDGQMWVKPPEVSAHILILYFHYQEAVL